MTALHPQSLLLVALIAAVLFSGSYAQVSLGSWDVPTNLNLISRQIRVCHLLCRLGLFSSQYSHSLVPNLSCSFVFVDRTHL
jgi:hypothetical protein